MDAVTSPDAALDAPSTRRAFDLLLMDLNYTGDTTSGREGIDLLARVQALDRLLPVIVMTGLGLASISPSRRCAAACATSCRSRGTTRSSSRIAARRDRGRTRAAPADASRAARARRGAAHPAQAAAAACRRSTAGSSRRRGSPPPASAAIASTRSAFGATRLGALDRRRRRQGHPRGAADVEPAGRGARVRDRRGRSPPSSASRSIASCAATSPKGASSASSTASSTRDLGVADVSRTPATTRRCWSAPTVSVERLDLGGPVLGVFPDGALRAGDRSRSAAAIAWSFHRRHHRSTQRRGRRVRRGPADRARGRAPRVQRAGAPGAAGRRRRRSSPAAHFRTTRR